MRTGLGLPSTDAKAPAKGRHFGVVAVLVLGLAVSACVGSGQLANLTETARPSIAFESIDGPPSAVVLRFVTMLKDEAAQHQITVGSPGEVNYGLRGYLAVQSDDTANPDTSASNPASVTNSIGGSITSSISWTLDVYDGDQHRVVRLSGREKAAGRLWVATDDPALRRVARAGMDQLAAFLATTRAPAAAGPGAAPQRAASGSGWLDDWTPEAAGIFRIFGREPSRPATAAETRVQSPADDVPLPRGRPAPAAGVAPGAAIASATRDPAENSR
jgi:hypothetical protein